VVWLVLAGAFALVAAGLLTRVYRQPRRCHYCGVQQAPRGLHKIELSGAGVVEVCGDDAACRKRHQRSWAR